MTNTAEPRYAELDVTTNFTFLRGGSHGEELVHQAAALGHAAIAVADANTLAGVVRAHVAAKEAGIQFIVGARLILTDAPSLLAYPTSRAAYGRLCRLLTRGQRRAEKGECLLTLDDVAEHADGLIFIALPPFIVIAGLDRAIQHFRGATHAYQRSTALPYTALSRRSSQLSRR